MTRRLSLLLVAVVPLLLMADPVAAGKYSGKWQGASGASGDFRMTLASSGNWTAEIVFTLGGQDVKCTVKSLTVDGSKVHAVYSFDLQGNVLESTIDGELSGKKLAGKYTTRVTGDGSAVDEGTWETTASD